MKFLANVSAAAVSILVVTSALSQSATPPSSTSPASTVATSQAGTVPVSTSKRMACVAAAIGSKGQEHQDQMQLCMAQAHLDCLKQAIDQKVVGEDRKEFIRNCVGL